MRNFAQIAVSNGYGRRPIRAPAVRRSNDTCDRLRMRMHHDVCRGHDGEQPATTPDPHLGAERLRAIDGTRTTIRDHVQRELETVVADPFHANEDRMSFLSRVRWISTTAAPEPTRPASPAARLARRGARPMSCRAPFNCVLRRTCCSGSTVRGRRERGGLATHLSHGDAGLTHGQRGEHGDEFGFVGREELDGLRSEVGEDGSNLSVGECTVIHAWGVTGSWRSRRLACRLRPLFALYGCAGGEPVRHVGGVIRRPQAAGIELGDGRGDVGRETVEAGYSEGELRAVQPSSRPFTSVSSRTTESDATRTSVRRQSNNGGRTDAYYVK